MCVCVCVFVCLCVCVGDSKRDIGWVWYGKTQILKQTRMDFVSILRVETPQDGATGGGATSGFGLLCLVFVWRVGACAFVHLCSLGMALGLLCDTWRRVYSVFRLLPCGMAVVADKE